MSRTSKAWRVTVVLELNRGMSADEFRDLTAHSHGRAVLNRGSRTSELAPELSMTAVALASRSEDALAKVTGAVEQRFTSMSSDNRVVRIRTYLVAA